MGGPVPGRLLLHDIAAQQAAPGAPQQQDCVPRRAPPGSGIVSADRPAASAARSSSGAGGGVGGAPQLQVVLVDEALSDIPVPTVYVGGLPAPIPSGRPTIDADELVRQLQQGQLPSDSLPKGDREAWRAASRITDPISAYNICQAQQLAGGRRVVLTERGVAEQLARGAIQMVPASSASASKRAGGLPNPFAPLVRLASSLADGQELSRKVQSHATTLEQRGNSANAQQQQEASQGISASASQPPAAAESPASAPSGAGEPRQYCLQDVPARRLLAGGSPPQLAWVPLRVALALLHALPQHFLLMQGVAPAEGQPKGKQRRHKGQGSEGGSEGSGGSGASAARSTFNAWSSPSALEVCVIPGLTIQQVTPEGSMVDFTPAFVSHGSAQALWRDVREISGGALLMYRRLERSLMRRRLEAAAAIIASGGLRGQQGGAAAAQDDDEGGMEEPPEISEFVRELGSSLGADHSSLGGGGGLQAPSGGLPRLVATFACGCVSLAAQGLNWAGNTADWLLMATPLGPRLLGIPEAAIERHRLADLLAGCQRYNRDQALLRCVVHSAAAQLAAAQQRHEAQPQGAGGAAGGAAVPQGAEPAFAPQPQASPGQGHGAAADGAATQAAEAAGAAGATAAPSYEAQRAAAAALAGEASLRYRRLLAAAALWVGLTAKIVGEDPGTGGGSLGRLLAKSLLQQGTALSTASLGGLGGSTRLQSQVSLPTGAPSLHAPANEVPSSMQEAVEQVLSAGLPVLEHNGFAPLFSGSPDGSSSATHVARSGASGAAAAGAGVGALGPAAVAVAVAGYCTANTHLGLGLTRDGGSAGGGYRLLALNPLAPPPAGRGIVLVGELDLGLRPRGRTPGRTAARWLTVGVDDGRKLL